MPACGVFVAGHAPACKGYDGTSLDDLTGAMGIPRSSLYIAFEGKEALFRRAIDRYAETRLLPLPATLERGGSLEADLRAFGAAAVVVLIAAHGPAR